MTRCWPARSGGAVLRIADEPLPQQRAAGMAEAVAGYVAELAKLAETERQAYEAQAALLRDHAYQLAADPTKASRPPVSLGPVPYLELAVLENASARLKENARGYDAALTHAGAALPADQLAKLQALMLTIDQTLAPDVGLPGRGWYKNLVYAPGRFTGYQAKTLPGVREAIEEHRWTDADRYARLTADALNAYSNRLDQARLVLEQK